MKQFSKLWLLMFFFASISLIAQNTSNGLANQNEISKAEQLKLKMIKNIYADRQPGIIPGINQTNGNHYGKFQGPNSTLDILWDNGPMITAEGAGSNGSHYSEVQDALGMGTYGTTCALSVNISIADDFEVTDNWNIESFTFYGFHSPWDTLVPDTISLITAAYVKVYDGNPSAGGNVIFGDFTTNLLSSTQWTNTWRVWKSEPIEDRPIMEVVADVPGLLLLPGTYWVEVILDGTDDLPGPFMPHVTILGETTTGNAIQNFSPDGWFPIGDVGPEGIPFLVNGNTIPQSDNDVSIHAIVEPTSGVDLTVAEPIAIEIKNHGVNVQTDIPYEVSWDGPSGLQTVNGTFAGPLASGASVLITLSQTADLSAYGNYHFEACTQLAGDEFSYNDCKTKIVSNSAPGPCMENLYIHDCYTGEGLISWELENISIPDIPCSGNPSWHQNYSDMVHNLSPGDFKLTVTAGFTDTYFDVWIDFNDDLILTDDEIVLNDAFCAAANVPYKFTLSIPADANPGQHVLRFRTNWGSEVLDPCETYGYGNCCDFLAIIGDPTAIIGPEATSFKIYPNPAVDMVSIESELEIKSVKLYNITGELVYDKPLHSKKLQLNTSQFNKGVYTLKLENETATAIRKLIIK